MTILVRELANLPYKRSVEFVTTSLQIKIEAEKVGLKIADEGSFVDHRCGLRWSGSDRF